MLTSYNLAGKCGYLVFGCGTVSLKTVSLLFPFIVTLLSDNPMKSEFTCHLGQGGKFFLPDVQGEGVQFHLR